MNHRDTETQRRTEMISRVDSHLLERGLLKNKKPSVWAGGWLCASVPLWYFEPTNNQGLSK